MVGGSVPPPSSCLLPGTGGVLRGILWAWGPEGIPIDNPPPRMSFNWGPSLSLQKSEAAYRIADRGPTPPGGSCAAHRVPAVALSPPSRARSPCSLARYGGTIDAGPRETVVRLPY